MPCAWPAEVVAALSSVPGVLRAEAMGSLRRFRETIGDVDVVAVSAGDPEAVMTRFVTLPMAAEVVAHGARKSAIVASSGIQVDLRVVEPHQYGSAALYFTGSKAHNIRLRQLAIERGWSLSEYGLAEAESGRVLASATEEEIYAALGLQWVPPELREDAGEIELAAAGTLPRLIEEGDLRGDLHVHTDLSGDGREPLEAMIAAAAARGYEYVAITDHGRGPGDQRRLPGAVGGAAVPDRGAAGALPRHGHPPRGGTEHRPQTGAWTTTRRSSPGFDWAVAGVHTHFELDREAQTRRLVTAMRNPAVRAIAHLSGRRIGLRPGIDLDVEAVLAAAEETGTAIEINCHLDRLDASHGRAACRPRAGRGAPHRHRRPRQPGNWPTRPGGCATPGEAWVEPERVANTWPRERFLAWAAGRALTPPQQHHRDGALGPLLVVGVARVLGDGEGPQAAALAGTGVAGGHGKRSPSTRTSARGSAPQVLVPVGVPGVATVRGDHREVPLHPQVEEGDGVRPPARPPGGGQEQDVVVGEAACPGGPG